MPGSRCLMPSREDPRGEVVAGRGGSGKPLSPRLPNEAPGRRREVTGGPCFMTVIAADLTSGDDRPGDRARSGRGPPARDSVRALLPLIGGVFEEDDVVREQ